MKADKLYMMSTFWYYYKVKYIKSFFLYGGLLASIFLLVDTLLHTPCSDIIEYDIGSFDERYRISKDDFLTTIQLAELPWEEVAEKPLFVYTPGADFKINMLWSENQERLYEGEDLEKDLNLTQGSIDGIQQRYEALVKQYDSARRAFTRDESTFQRELVEWNRNPGTQQEYISLKKKEADLEQELTALNTLGKTVNTLAQQSNAKIDEYNQGVNQYNGLFDGREFDAGNTDGRKINVYSFDGTQELYTLLVHEFGHVLGIDHIDDPLSTMHYLLNDENKQGILTDKDKEAFIASCRL